jgi:hypothetical protein
VKILSVTVTVSRTEGAPVTKAQAVVELPGGKQTVLPVDPSTAAEMAESLEREWEGVANDGAPTLEEIRNALEEEAMHPFTVIPSSSAKETVFGGDYRPEPPPPPPTPTPRPAAVRRAGPRKPMLSRADLHPPPARNLDQVKVPLKLEEGAAGEPVVPVPPNAVDPVKVLGIFNPGMNGVDLL